MNYENENHEQYEIIEVDIIEIISNTERERRHRNKYIHELNYLSSREQSLMAIKIWITSECG